MYRLVQITDPEGTYCCHLSPKELREATIEYNQRERGWKLDLSDPPEVRAKFRAAKLSGPVIDPTLNGEVPELDHRFEALKKRAEYVKLTEKISWLRNEKLASLREEWRELADLINDADPRGEEYKRRDEAEVSYCHRDPSDWQITHEIPLEIRERIEKLQDRQSRVEVGALTMQQEEYLTRRALIAYRKSQIDVAWKKLHDGDPFGVIVKSWVRHPETGKYLRPDKTISKTEFIWRFIKKHGDELEGYNKALDSIRFRLLKKRERKGK